MKPYASGTSSQYHEVASVRQARSITTRATVRAAFSFTGLGKLRISENMARALDLAAPRGAPSVAGGPSMISRKPDQQ
jgi:hypothetical protein